MCLCVNKCVLVCCGWCWLPEADYHPHPSVLFLPVSPPVWKLCGHPLDCLTAEACRTLLSSYPSVLLIFFPLCRVSSFLHFSVERWRGRECERERRGEQGGRAEIWELVEEGGWRDGALEERSSGGASEGRGVRGWGGHSSWTMDEQRERERGPLEVLELFSLSLRFSSFSWERPLLLLLSFLLHPAPRRLWYTRSTRHPPPLPPPPPLPLAPSACLPSLLPGGLGQCWRRSRDLQEICLSEKQLVRLSTANVCMLGPPPPLLLGGARARPGQGTVGVLSPCLPFSLHLQAVILLSFPFRWPSPLWFHQHNH